MQNTQGATEDRLNIQTTTPKLEKFISGLFENLQYGKLRIQWSNGTVREYVGKNASRHAGLESSLVIHDSRFYKRVLSGGTLGFAESYLDGQWSSSNLAKLLEILSLNLHQFEAKIDKNILFKSIQRLIHVLRPNTRRGAQKNIHAHYDLGNDFYSQWLDPSMTYSSARFSNSDMSLEEAQWEKYRALADMIDLRSNHHVLEIGCGWGGFAEFAAREIGCKVTGLTISREQLAYAQNRIAEKELADRVDLKFMDYRDMTEQFDRIVSIEMFEAVGEKYWPTYFNQIHDCLKPGGQAGLQIITIDNKRFAAYRKRTDFIQKYIFPGGMLPSPEKLGRAFTQANLRQFDRHDFGIDYADTLAQWCATFLEKWDDISQLGFDKKFRRMWQFDMAYCEAGFRSGHIDVSQFALKKQT